MFLAIKYQHPETRKLPKTNSTPPQNGHVLHILNPDFLGKT